MQLAFLGTHNYCAKFEIMCLCRDGSKRKTCKNENLISKFFSFHNLPKNLTIYICLPPWTHRDWMNHNLRFLCINISCLYNIGMHPTNLSADTVGVVQGFFVCWTRVSVARTVNLSGLYMHRGNQLTSHFGSWSGDAGQGSSQAKVSTEVSTPNLNNVVTSCASIWVIVATMARSQS